MAAETGAGTSGNETGRQTAVAADVQVDSKPAGPTRKTKQVEVSEAYVLELMWHKACRPRYNFPAWKPKPDDPRAKLAERVVAIIYERHRHEDDLILQYITNGHAYEELEIGDDK